MAEAQSRYGIIEELNNRKINVKEKLANIERDTDGHIYEAEKKIDMISNDISEKEKAYKREHSDWKREQVVTLTLIEQEYNRKKETIEKTIEESDKTYESDFQSWKKGNENEVKEMEKELVRYKNVQKTKIAEKNDILKEIDNGINSLKEISKDQNKE